MKIWDVSDNQYTDITKSDEIANNSKNHPINNVMAYDSANKTHLLKDLLNSKPKIIIQYSSSVCSYCIEHILEFTKKYENKFGLENMIILIRFRNERNFLIYKQNNNMHPRAFSIYNENLDLPADSLHLPYIVVSDSSLLPIDVFIPMKESPERTNHYFNKILIENFN